ncbi:hypothetical protein GCM10023307_27010 [Lysobacter hankyongensis]|uniref:Uncharacterized protein n=1 Tax=Lysobacter hankyongensis TaxID=1176535 RepID=A0ABP9BUB3_9GAMM
MFVRHDRSNGRGQAKKTDDQKSVSSAHLPKEGGGGAEKIGKAGVGWTEAVVQDQ